MMMARKALKLLKPKIKTLKSVVKTMAGAGAWRNDSMSSTERGYGYKWQQARLVFLSANPLCVYCNRTGRVTKASVVDHIVPHRGDQKLFWSRSNWQALCASCHSSTKQKEENNAFQNT